MAQAKRGSSPHTKRRHALQRIAELEARQAKLERSRPRTPGKRGAKTRGLNTIARQLRAARGALTKARNAIAKAASGRGAAKRVATAKRSQAAKKGWGTRRARIRAIFPVPPGVPSAVEASGLTMPFLFRDGWARVLPATKAERSLVGRHLNAMALALAGQTVALDAFEGQSIFDFLRSKRVPFVTDLQTIVEFEGGLDVEFTGFYKRRNELTSFEARDYE